MALNLNTRTESSKSPELLVIMDADRSTVMKSPGLDKPFSTTNAKYADYVARQMLVEHGFKCVVVPYLDAIQFVIKHPRNQRKANGKS